MLKLVQRKSNPNLKPEHELELINEINDDLNKRKKRILVRRENLNDMADLHKDIVRWYSWLPQSDTNEQVGTLCLYEASLMRSFYHRLAMKTDEPQSIQIPGYPLVTWEGKGILDTGFISPSMWLDAYFISVIVRDKSSMDLLANFPISLMKQSSTKAGELSYMLVDLIQSFHHRTSDYPDKLVEAMDSAIAQGDDWAMEIAMGILETYAALTTDIGYDFEEVLIKNLKLQEQYHLRELGPERIGIRTFINFPLLGMACMWYDKGNRLSVETGWLPPYLVEGRWLEEAKAGRITR